MQTPTEFRNVTAVVKANSYFDGRVVSHTILLPDHSRKTLGLIYPGKFHFGTNAAERMEITAGSCRVKLDGKDVIGASSLRESVADLMPNKKMEVKLLRQGKALTTEVILGQQPADWEQSRE